MKKIFFSPNKKKLALTLFDLGAFQDKTKSKNGAGFKLKLHEKNPRAPLSPIYLNLRTPDNPKPGPLTPEAVNEIGKILYQIAQKHRLKYDRVVGVPRAGDPLTEAFYKMSGKKGSLLRLSKIEEATGRQVSQIIEGGYEVGDGVLLIDDLITKADSKLEAIKILEEEGLQVIGILLLVDREQGGSEQLRKMGYDVYTVFTLSELLKFYLQAGKISQELFNEIKEYLASN